MHNFKCKNESNFFSTLDQQQRGCQNPVLTIGFPNRAPGFNSVVLANGAVVNLDELGRIIADFCPAFCTPKQATQPLVQCCTTGTTSPTETFSTNRGLFKCQQGRIGDC